MEEIHRYIYIKKPLNEFFSDAKNIPDEFLLEWYKDTFDYMRIHSDEELREFMELTPGQVLKWLDEAARFTWEIKKSRTIITKQTR